MKLDIYKIGSVLAVGAIIWLLSDVILSLWMNYVGVPIFGQIESTCINDLCVLTIMFMFLWFLWKNKNQKEKHFLFTNIGLCLLFGGGVLYSYPRFANTASFTLFYNFPILAYADVFPLCIILSIFNKKWRKSQKDESDKKNDSIKDAINSYLKKDATNYAIMIANDWGTGKTYYWKNALAPMILKEESYKPIYVSAFGIQSVEELHSKIIEEIHPIFKGYLTKMLMALCNWVLRVFGANLNSKETRSIIRYMKVDWDKFVICIDDFERFAQKDSIVSYLGYFNKIIEHCNAKIIFIANEKKIDNNNYKDYKEKLIRYTYYYFSDVKEVILEYINNELQNNSDFKLYLIEKVDYIANLCTRTNTVNLRSLFFFLENYKQIYTFVKKRKMEEEYERQVIDHFLFLSFMYSIEYKRNNIHLLKTMDVARLKNAIYEKWQNSISKSYSFELKKYSEEQQEQIKLIELYYGLGLIEIYQSKASFDFISNGYFPEEEYKYEIEEYIVRIKRKEISPDEDLLNRLKRLWDIEDEEMNSNIEESLSLVEKGTINLKFYPSFWVALMKIKNNDFATIDKDISELLFIFKKGIEISRKTAQHIPNMESYFTMEDYDYGDNETYKEIRDLVLKYNNEIYLVEKQKKLKTKVKDCTFEVLEELCPLEIPIESIITSQEFFDEIKKAANNKKGDYINFLRNREVALLLKYDESFLRKLEIVVNDYLMKNSQSCVSKKYIVLLKETIENKLKKIT